MPAFKEDKAALDRIGPAALSANRKFGLHTYEQDLYLFDTDAGQARRLTSTPKAEEQLAELSPTGAQAAFVRDNDLYLVDCQTGEERRLTHDGSSDLLNGILDWVYQEEIYGRGQFRAFWFSPMGSSWLSCSWIKRPFIATRSPTAFIIDKSSKKRVIPKLAIRCPLRGCGWPRWQQVN